MEISRLKNGMVLKNYKELCDILDVIPTDGNSKKKQMNELSLYCDYHKEGYKIIIDKVYETPTITLDELLKKKNSKYIYALSNVLLEYLYNNNEDGAIDINTSKMFNVLGIVNQNYECGNRFKKELHQMHDIRQASVEYFYSNTRNEFKTILERCLDNLQKRKVLMWNRCIMIVDGDNVYKADNKTVASIINAEKRALEKLKLPNMYYVFKSKKIVDKFFDLVESKINLNYYYAYSLIIGDVAIEIEMNNIEKEKQNVNELFMDKSKSIFNRKLYKNYKDDYDKLIDLLIDTSQEENIYKALLDKHKENINGFVNEYGDNERYYNDNKRAIEDKYLNDNDRRRFKKTKK